MLLNWFMDFRRLWLRPG